MQQYTLLSVTQKNVEYMLYIRASRLSILQVTN